MRQTGGVTCLVRHGLRPLTTDEPDALIGHVRVCGGSGGQPLLLPGTATRQKAARDAGVKGDSKCSLRPVLSDSSTSDFTVVPDANSIEACLANVRSSDFVIVILSRRYGPSLAKVGFEDLSATHLEYREAKKTGKPIYFYIRDRLDADYRIWKRNSKSEDIKLIWVQSEQDYSLFKFIDEHQNLKAGVQVSNWLSTFQNTLDLKQMISRELRAPAGRASLSDAIHKNLVPIIHGTATLQNGRNAFEAKIVCDFCNHGIIPAYNLITYWAGDRTGLTPTPVVPPNAHFVRIAIVTSYPDGNPAPLNFTLFDSVLHIEYQTPEGHHVHDTFQVKVRLIAPAINPAYAFSILFESKNYKVGLTPPFQIEE
jgi:hypothetical protein